MEKKILFRSSSRLIHRARNSSSLQKYQIPSTHPGTPIYFPLPNNCPVEYACSPPVIRRDKTSYFVSNGSSGSPGAFPASRRHRRVVEYRHVILKKEGPTEKLAANDNGVIWKNREAITFGGKFIFLGVA